MKNNNVLIITLSVFVSLLAGFSIVIGIGRAVEITTAPVIEELSRLVEVQGRLEKKIAGLEETLKNNRQPSRPPQPERPQMDLTTVHEIPLDGSYVLGPDKASVTIVGFFDLQCPYCARFYPPVEEAMKAYPKDVRFVMKNFPLGFHPTARPAAKAALAAGLQGKYYEMGDLLMKSHQNQTEEKFKELAGQLGLNVDQFMKDLKDKDAEFEKRIQADLALAEKLGVGGTPTFYLNGRQTMARDAAAWKNEIEAVLKAGAGQK